MEILAPERYEELEEFVAHHPRGEFTQSPRWRLVKENWDYAAVVSRDADGKIKGSMGVLIQKIPVLHTALLYAPRGPSVTPMTGRPLPTSRREWISWQNSTMPMSSRWTRIFPWQTVNSSPR